MQVIVIRHGDALPVDQAETMGLSDGERPLTNKGRRETRAAAAGLRQLLGSSPVDYMLISPLLRARQTADILRDYLDDPVADESDAMAPTADVQAIDTLLHGYDREDRLLLVGHAPNLGIWTSWSLARKHNRFTTFKTNGVALLEFPGVAEGGTGTLHWQLTGMQLRALAPQTAG